jgi:hypothetical protein
MFAYLSTRHIYQLTFTLFACVCAAGAPVQAKRRAPAGGQRAVVVDERLAVLRAAPSLTAPLVQRLGRGRAVALLGARRAADGVAFYQVAVTRRTRGWLQAESLVAPTHAHADEYLLRLIQASTDFDRIARARIFLDEFPRSPLRPGVLLLYAAAAEEAAVKLSHDAERRLKEEKLPEAGAPVQSYYLNYSGLDRYRKQGIVFRFDSAARRFHYDGESWREIVRRYPRSAEATEARKQLALLVGDTAR